MNGLEKFNNIFNNLEIINLGSSHGKKSFYYTHTNYKCFNFGLDSQNFYYDYQLLIKYNKYFQNDCIVILPISFFSFGKMNNLNDTELNKNLRYYNILNYNQIIGKSIDNYIIYKLLPILSAQSRILFLIHDCQEKVNQEVFIDDSSEVVKSHERQAKNILNYYINIYYLNNIIDLCNKKGYKILFVTTPFTKNYLKKYPKKEYLLFKKTLTKVVNSKRISYLDYSADNRFIDNNDLFLDSDHLNQKGARLFTSIVIEDLIKREYLKKK